MQCSLFGNHPVVASGVEKALEMESPLSFLSYRPDDAGWEGDVEKRLLRRSFPSVVPEDA